jgi:cell division protein FtsL
MSVILMATLLVISAATMISLKAMDYRAEQSVAVMSGSIEEYTQLPNAQAAEIADQSHNNGSSTVIDLGYPQVLS